jgi:hypothetical protein
LYGGLAVFGGDGFGPGSPLRGDALQFDGERIPALSDSRDLDGRRRRRPNMGLPI